MKTLYFASAIIFASAAFTSASAAPWTAVVTADINSGNYDAINQVVAATPSAAGDIAAFLLQQAQNDVGTPGKSVKLLQVAVPLAGQIPSGDVPGVIGDIQTLLNLANNPGFQNSNPKGAAKVFTGILNLLALPNLSGQNPKLQGQAVADAGAFLQSHPDDDDNLKDDVSLAMGFDLNGVNPDPDTIRFRRDGGPFEGPPHSPNNPPPSAE